MYNQEEPNLKICEYQLPRLFLVHYFEVANELESLHRYWYYEVVMQLHMFCLENKRP